MSEPTGILTLPADADPALGFAQPDIEWHVYQVIKPLGGTITWAYGAAQDWPAAWLFVTHLQVDVRAARKGRARERADQARRAICALPWTRWDEGVVNRVDVLDGPFWQPDHTNAPRYVARYAIWYHPARNLQGTPSGGEHDHPEGE